MESKKNLIIRKIEEWMTIFFFCAGVFVLIFLTQALLLTWLGQFKTIYILISLLTSSTLTAIFFRFIKNDIKLIPRLNSALFSIILLVSFTLILFPHDNFGGNDESVYSGVAMILSKYHNISVPLYLFKTPLLYGTTNQAFVLTTPTYVVWLATQKVLFGVGWMLRSNVILIFLGLCSLYLVSSLIAKKSLAFVTVLLFSTTMPFLWFMRETMTENMAFFLLWFLILSLFLFIKTKKNYFLISLFLSSWLFSFTRNEGLFIQIPVLFIFTSILLIQKVIPVKKIFFISIIYTFFIFLSFFITNSFLPLNKNPEVSNTIINFTQRPPKINLIRLRDRFPLFAFQMNSKQNLSLALYSFILVTVLIIFSKKKVIKDKILYICLIGIISVEFLKLINPSISLQQPWLYRRYLYALLPLGYLSLSILLSSFLRKKILLFIFCSLLIVNLVLSSKIITLKNKWYITEKIEKLTQNISAKDFVIIDGYILGNYYPASYMTFNKLVRNLYYYWIEPGNWRPQEKTYQGLPYSKLFLLTDVEDKSYKNFRLKKINSVEVESKQLQPNCDLFTLSKELQKTIDIGRLPYVDVIKYCSKVDNDIIKIKKSIFLYEMEY